ncbi:hypothetical protein ACFFNY_31180 [Paenibacillus hodogayensis]|uniref:PD-(D/E)XK endonuclease-like domain-containing protein n=1 Tax=Paenibacillus hodogayensis TaxID=279208 RepID=A0ABV5W667_9BACL
MPGAGQAGGGGRHRREMIARAPEAKSGAVRTGIRLIEDYRLEELLRCPFRMPARKTELSARTAADIGWRQIVQYSASHIVNDYFSSLPEYRTQRMIRHSADRRWSNKAYKFESPDHYWFIRSRTIDNLIRFLEEGRDIVPIVLFESFRCHIPAVAADVSFIVQMLHRPGDDPAEPFVLQKYVVDDDPAVIAGFRHLAVLFCSEAFGALPGRIELFGVLSGNRYVFRPQPEDLAKAADYVSLLRDYIPYASKADSAPASREEVCGKCALRVECDREDRHTSASFRRHLLH